MRLRRSFVSNWSPGSKLPRTASTYAAALLVAVGAHAQTASSKRVHGKIVWSSQPEAGAKSLTIRPFAVDKTGRAYVVASRDKAIRILDAEGKTTVNLEIPLLASGQRAMPSYSARSTRTALDSKWRRS